MTGCGITRHFVPALVAALALAAFGAVSGCGYDDSGTDIGGEGSGDGGADAGGDTVADADADADAAGDAGPGPTLGGCPMFPPDNPWNTPIDDAPLHERSAAFIESMGGATALHPDFGTEWEGAPIGIPYTLVPASQPLVDVVFDYADESEPGPYPIPLDALIEGGPDADGDRHILLLQTGSCTLYEIFSAYPPGAAGEPWTAGSGAIWHLDRNEVRPDGWTSADAAGLAILPGLVRYDEAVEQGEIRHAIRITVNGAQRAYIYPATHSDGRGGSDPDAPPMGLRPRLRADFDMSGFSAPVQVILRAMQRYGVMVADTGTNWYVTGVPDTRWNDDMLVSELRRVLGSDFEAVYTGEPHPY